MIAVLKRELKSLFCGYRGYAFIAVFAVGYCVIRMIYNYMLLYDNIYGFINHEYILMLLPAVFALAIPVMTFSMYENERKKDVFAFLRSLPLTSENIVFGKYLAKLLVFGVTYAVIIVVDCVLGFYSGSSVLTVIFSIISYLLICNCILAVNVFFASVFKNKFAALGAGYGIAIAFTALTVLRNFMSHIWSEIVTPISIFGTYVPSAFGVIDIASLFLWLSVGGLFIYLSYASMKKEIKCKEARK
ncbi:MAG: hypothetical protein IJ011_08360 [Clostridia bacterium]|nr:hypothetical protein [Clostridia bacterium]